MLPILMLLLMGFVQVALPFSKEQASLLEALASQAAVSIENSVLVSQIQQLFEGFVSASVTAIEQRDPTTSGHSFRVAELTTELALVLRRKCVLGGVVVEAQQV